MLHKVSYITFLFNQLKTNGPIWLGFVGATYLLSKIKGSGIF